VIVWQCPSRGHNVAEVKALLTAGADANAKSDIDRLNSLWIKQYNGFPFVICQPLQSREYMNKSRREK